MDQKWPKITQFKTQNQLNNQPLALFLTSFELPWFSCSLIHAPSQKMKVTTGFGMDVFFTPQPQQVWVEFPGLLIVEGSMDPACNDQAKASLLSDGRGNQQQYFLVQPSSQTPTKQSLCDREGVAVSRSFCTSPQDSPVRVAGTKCTSLGRNTWLPV